MATDHIAVTDLEATSLVPFDARLMRVDLQRATGLLSVHEVQYLVDRYYAIQDVRLAAGLQGKALKRQGEPNLCLSLTEGALRFVERQIRARLDRWTTYDEPTGMGEWLRSIVGIGPVLAAALLTIDLDRPTVGHVWAHCGLDPTKSWRTGEKRPWNARLKAICAFKMGEVFVKTQNREGSIYGRVFAARKVAEWRRNLDGRFAVQAATGLAKLRSDDTEAGYWYSGCLSAEAARVVLAQTDQLLRAKLLRELAGEPGSGVPMLPPAHIHARARRYAVKALLADYYEEYWRRVKKEEPPLPFPLAHLGHVHRHGGGTGWLCRAAVD